MRRFTRFRAGPAILIGLSACGGAAGGGPAARSGSSATSGGGTAPVAMTVDGKPVEFTGAIATGLGGHAIEIELASHALACGHPEEAHAAGDPDKHLVLTLAPVLAPDGKSAWHIISTFFDDASRVDDGGAVQVGGDADSAVDVMLPALSLQGGGEPASQLAFPGGALHAIGCHAKPVYMFTGESRTPPASRPQTGLSFSVAGVTEPIDSALLIRSKEGSQLVLTTGRQSCDASTDTPDLSWTLLLDARGAPQGAVLAGAIFDQQREQRFEGGSGAPKVGVSEAAGGQVPVKIDGAYDHQGYAVKLAGSVQALVCDRP